MMPRIILILARTIVGCVFVFSGFVKAIDPWGFTYKIQDYLAAMGEFFTMFNELAFFAAVVLSAIEFVVGVNLVLGIRPKETTIVATLLMLVMTPLTLWIAIEDPVQDCGCFGDALVISNWATFWKNIVLSALIAVIFIFRNKQQLRFRSRQEWVFTATAFIFSVLMSIYCYRHLPIIDFRPYKIGANIIEGMVIPDDAPADEFEITLIYEKDGVEKSFTLDNYPKNDSTWTFVDQQSVLIKKGYEPPIHDFTLDTDEGDITDEVLADEGYTFFAVGYELERADMSKKDVNHLQQIYSFAQKNGYRFYVLTASVDEEIEKFKNETGIDYPIALTDKITLKTIVRDNPGIVLIKNATVLNKWALHDAPDFKEPLENSDYGKMQTKSLFASIITSVTIFLVLLFIVFLIEKTLYNRKNGEN